MPSTQSKRIVVLKSEVSATTVAELSVNMEALFDTPGVEITYEDASDPNEVERTEYKMVFSSAVGSSVGAVTLRLVGDPAPVVGSGVSVSKAMERFDFEPRARETSVTLLAAPAASFERVWKQKVKDPGQSDVVDNVAKFEVRVAAESGYSVTQTLRSAEDGELVLLYDWSGAASGSVVSGSVTLSTSATAGAGYTLGAIRVTDSEPSGGSARRR